MSKPPSGEGEERRRPGPKPETFKVEGMDWEEAMKRALQVKRPPEGWPEEVKRTPKKRGPK